MDLRITNTDGTCFEMKDANIEYVRDVFPAWDGWTVTRS